VGPRAGLDAVAKRKNRTIVPVGQGPRFDTIRLIVYDSTRSA